MPCQSFVFHNVALHPVLPRLVDDVDTERMEGVLRRTLRTRRT